MPPLLAKLIRAALPGILLVAIALALWNCIAHTPSGIAGWTLLLLPLTTVATILTTSQSQTPLLSHALMSLLTAPLLITLCPSIGPAPAAALWALLTAWSALWSATTWSLRRFGPVFSAAGALKASCLAMALPVIAMPLVHAAAHWGFAGTVSPWQNRLVQTIAHACPCFPALNTLRPAIKIDWGTLPGMYAWSGLGQEIPLDLPNPWLCTSLYAVTGLLILLLGIWLGPPKPAPAPSTV